MYDVIYMDCQYQVLQVPLNALMLLARCEEGHPDLACKILYHVSSKVLVSNKRRK